MKSHFNEWPMPIWPTRPISFDTTKFVWTSSISFGPDQKKSLHTEFHILNHVQNVRSSPKQFGNIVTSLDAFKIIWTYRRTTQQVSTVKLGNKERFDKEQIGIKELFIDYQPFYTINLLLDKELLPISKMPNLGIKELKIVKISEKRGLSVLPDSELSLK